MTFLLDAAYRFMESGGTVNLMLVLTSLAMWTLILNRLLVLRALGGGKTIKSEMARDFSVRRTGDCRLDRKIADELALSAQLPLDQGLGLIGALAAVAPLLGLLGTVLGMIGAFDVITVYGTGNARALSAGISKALVTTEAGLLVAIPGMYMQGVLSRMAERLCQQAQCAGIRLKSDSCRHVPAEICERKRGGIQAC